VFRKSPVHDLRLAKLSNHDVAGLKVPVNDSLRMGVADSLCDLQKNTQRVYLGEPRVLWPVQNAGEGLALN